MKGKFVLSVMIISMFSVDANALEIKKGKLIEHKEWTTGNVQGFIKEKIKDTKDKLISLQQLQVMNMSESVPHEDNILVSNKIDTINIPLGSASEIPGYVNVDITNFTSTPQIYNITSKLCVIHIPDYDDQCFLTSDKIQLDPNGNNYMYRSMILSYQFVDQDGWYFAELSTSVKKDNSDTVFTTKENQLVNFKAD
jgi:hypothetical protein